LFIEIGLEVVNLVIDLLEFLAKANFPERKVRVRVFDFGLPPKGRCEEGVFRE